MLAHDIIICGNGKSSHQPLISQGLWDAFKRGSLSESLPQLFWFNLSQGFEFLGKDLNFFATAQVMTHFLGNDQEWIDALPPACPRNFHCITAGTCGQEGNSPILGLSQRNVSRPVLSKRIKILLERFPGGIARTKKR